MEQDNRYCEYKQMEEDEPIDWAKYVAALLKNWKKIAIITFVSAALSVIVALNQSRVYNVSVTLAPESSGGSRGGAIGGLASMFGVNLGGGSSSSDAMNITVFPEIAASTPFLTSLFDVELDKMPKISNQVKNDPEALKQDNEYMFGPSLLICPVIKPMSEAASMDVYLPKSEGGWEDYYTGVHYSGGQTIPVVLTKDHIPFFVRKSKLDEFPIRRRGGEDPYMRYITTK